ncbi:hypothetical protein CH289_26635 [Rhodococcus sp. RS1C4]|uniref:UbiA family prenyltransferase n=1 Tax=Nocardiaceae TaxID=85025 RepID=UPI0009B8909C|nr:MULTISPECIES: UbiA family prenyltransferase [Rhodococcus]OZC51315.1 hypothetical protein CH267_20940 [Rhodococcus sp. 06-621-2]OZC60734.1 hypothetical protein CH277_27175 [Rhodococcus sp. 06-469-3-2]OZC65276.1 hypothetical protein CH251_24550 [Rhodococcus sp. 06-462-5]OZC70980.1 hypothetical protein CH276_00530 [Rhodococcus sp. 06-470-2]OZC90065.1 hypothetical protein CH282_03500 [Rhodococcus sp. 06-418-1B]OZC94546.1 hypothetical protein CH254_00515 [Rhodococcus sp. 06-412-2C]OZC99470.1 h
MSDGWSYRCESVKHGTQVGRPGGASSPARNAWLCFVEARPQVQGVYLLRFAVGIAGVSATAGPVGVGQLAAGALTWWAVVISTYLFNGVTDVLEDVANASQRPIARGELAVRTARWVSVATAITALLMAAVAGREMWCWTFAFLTLGWVYSAPPLAAKRWSLSSSVVIFGLGWASYAAGAAAGGGGFGRTEQVFCASMATWMALVGAVVKDLSDAHGDAIGGRRTLAAQRGLSSARRLAIFGTTVVGVCAPIASLLWAPLALFGTLPLTAGALWVMALCARANDYDLKARRCGYRAFMATQYAANLAMLGTLLVRAV